MDKSVVITGVSSGIGFATAQTLIARGYHVFGSVRKAADGQRVQKELGAAFTPLLFDVTDHAALPAAVALVESMEQGIGLVNDFAPEHLSLIARDEAKFIPMVKTSGAIFLGNHSPVAAGDFLAGPSHTLPTGGAGKSFPGLMADMFQRRTSIVRLDAASMRKSAPIIAQIAGVEGLDAHARSATIRG